VTLPTLASREGRPCDQLFECLEQFRVLLAEFLASATRVSHSLRRVTLLKIVETSINGLAAQASEPCERLDAAPPIGLRFCRGHATSLLFIQKWQNACQFQAECPCFIQHS